jgi:signal transduction histidine kinase
MDLPLSPRIRATQTPPIPSVRAWAARYDGRAGPVLDLTQAVPGYPPHAELLAHLAEAAGSRAAAGYGPIDGDPARLQQVLTNLVNNALQHTPAGGRIGVSAMMAGSEVRLQVQDTGDGIAPGALPHIFDRLYRADSARSTDGSGLGLAIARAIVDLHQGHISATSTVGAGTTIELRLPAVRRAL